MALVHKDSSAFTFTYIYLQTQFWTFDCQVYREKNETRLITIKKSCEVTLRRRDELETDEGVWQRVKDENVL